MRRGIEFWKRHNQAYEAGSITQAEYCARHGVSRKTFARWRSIIRKSHESELEEQPEESAAARLVRVDVKRARAPASSHTVGVIKDAGVAVRSADWEIRVDVGFDQKTLCQVVRALRYS